MMTASGEASALLLVTTTLAIWVLDTASGVARQIDAGRGVYYGISFSNDALFIACRNAPVGADRESQNNSILCFDRHLVQRDVLQAPWPIRDVHQILQHDGTLYVCSTYDDAVLEYVLGRSQWRRWFPFGEQAGQYDRYHINSIFADREGFLLSGRGPHGWYARFGVGRQQGGVICQALGISTHNVWRDDRIVWVCSSAESAVRSDAGHVRVVQKGGWIRGVAQQGSGLYTGVSQNLVRAQRERSDCAVVRLEADGSTSRCFGFAGFGMLHDIRLLNAADATHNGIAFRLAEDWIEHHHTIYQTCPEMIDLTA